jgi:hypothetical protein
MKAIIIVAVAATLVGAFAAAQKSKEAVQSVKPQQATSLSGYLVDAMCAGGMAKHPETAMSKAARHTSACALEEDCAKSGFGVFSDGTWHKFDGEGDRQALALLKQTKTKRGVMVVAAGSQAGERFAVTSLTEQVQEGKPVKEGKK